MGSSKCYSKKVFKENEKPNKVTIDKSGSNKVVLDFYNDSASEEENIEAWQTKYLNNIIGQDHRFINYNINEKKIGRTYTSKQEGANLK